MANTRLTELSSNRYPYSPRSPPISCWYGKHKINGTQFILQYFHLKDLNHDPTKLFRRRRVNTFSPLVGRPYYLQDVQACPLRTIWLSNYIIHNEEGGRIVTNNARNVSHIVLYSITEQVLLLSSSTVACFELGYTSVTTLSGAHREQSVFWEPYALYVLIFKEREREMRKERWNHCPGYFWEVWLSFLTNPPNSNPTELHPILR
jgi:hypothetical protein